MMGQNRMSPLTALVIGVFSTGVIGASIMEFVGRGGDYTSAYPYVLDTSKDLTQFRTMRRQKLRRKLEGTRASTDDRPIVDFIHLASDRESALKR